jgi:hypothetical protein
MNWWFGRASTLGADAFSGGAAGYLSNIDRCILMVDKYI